MASIPLAFSGDLPDFCAPDTAAAFHLVPRPCGATQQEQAAVVDAPPGPSPALLGCSQQRPRPHLPLLEALGRGAQVHHQWPRGAPQQAEPSASAPERRRRSAIAPWAAVHVDIHGQGGQVFTDVAAQNVLAAHLSVDFSLASGPLWGTPQA